jgi:hypothetical protein
MPNLLMLVKATQKWLYSLDTSPQRLGPIPGR